MELVSKKKLMLFAGQGNEELSSEIAECLDVPLGDVKLSTFASGELYARYGESIRGADVFVVQSHCEPINDRIMQQLLMIDAAKRASARRITAVCPFYGYARQDRKAEGREPISARLARRHAHASRAPTASSASTSTPVRSRASSTARSTTSPRCRCSPTTWPSRSTATSWSCRPTPVAPSSPGASPTAWKTRASSPTSPSSTSAGPRAPTTWPRPPRSSATWPATSACSSTT